MPEKFARWDVTEYLNSREDACGYLEACLEEDPGDGSLLRAALGDIARAKEMGRFELDFVKGDEGVLQSLAENGNLTYAKVMKIARALGMQLRITA